MSNEEINVQPRRPAAPFEVMGFNGMGGLPEPRMPEIPQVAIPDRSQEYLQQANQSVDRSYETASQTIQAVGQARSARAEAGQRSGFANALQGTIGAIQAGVELYGNLEKQRTDRLNTQMEAQRKQVAAEYENIVMGNVADLRRAVGQNASDVGIIPTYTQITRNLREQYSPYLSPEVLQEITNISWTEIQNVAAQQGVRWQSELEDVQATVREQRTFQLKAGLMDIVNSMSHGPLSLNPDQALPLINQRISQFLTENDITGMDAMQVVNSVWPTIIAGMEAGGQNTSRMLVQQQELAAIMTEAQRINEEFSGNAEARNGALAPLQLRAEQLGLGITLSDIFLTDMQRFQNNADYVKTVQELQELQNNNNANGVPTDGVEGRAMSLVITAKAMEWVNNPVLNATEIERGAQEDSPEELRAAYRIFRDFTEDQEQVRAQREIIATTVADVSKAESELARYAQLIDPTGQLGPPVLTDQYSRSLFELSTRSATERPELSPQYAAALREWQGANVFEARTRRQNAEAVLQQLVTPWASVGVDILNPANTQGLQNLIEGMQPTLEQMRRGAQGNSTNAPLAPSNFSLGLPPLPQR